MALRKFFAVLVVLLAFIPPAHAHDALVGSDPADGASLAEAPSQVTLSFSGEPIDIAPQVLLRQDGETVATLEPTLSGFDVVADMPEIDPGTYQIAYSIVSSDGHRIEGFLTFTYGDGKGQAADGADGATTGAEVTHEDEDSGDNSAVALIRWGGIIVVVLGLSVIISRKLRERN